MFQNNNVNSNIKIPQQNRDDGCWRVRARCLSNQLSQDPRTRFLAVQVLDQSQGPYHHPSLPEGWQHDRDNRL